MKNALSRFSSTLALSVPAVALFAADAEAAAYIKFDGIDGEASSPDFIKHVEILSWSWGASNPTSIGGGGAGAGKVAMQDFHFTMRVNKSSPQLFLRCATGTHIPSVTLKFTRPSSTGAGEEQYYTVTLTDVMVTSVSGERSQPAAGSTDDRPVEKVSFHFQKIRIDYVAVDDPGNVISTGDIEIEQPAAT